MMALASSISASILPHLAIGSPYPFAPISTTKYIGAPHALIAGSHAVHVSGPALSPYWASGPLLSHGPGPIIAAHGSGPIIAAHGPVPLIAAPALLAEAKYTAVNRGAVHTAPLPGHVLSQSSVNLQPADGTL